VQGEGGFHPAPAELLIALRQVCDRHGILLIADEVQTGFARTGRMFGIEDSGVEPDMVTVAKSLAGGFPLSGVIGRAMTMDAVAPGGLGGTYAGSPVACAAALAVLDVIRDENLLDAANRIGSVLRGELARIASRNDTVALSNIRGPGAMIAFDIVATRGGNDPEAATAKRVTQAALAEGLVLLTCGIHGNTIRLLMPLVISDAHLVEGLERLERALISAQA
jgi:4-aminobutyrate aminotransferase / (S)-3-amino-2-methylpropionate transaminase / 5-aminovalerate transaminase